MAISPDEHELGTRRQLGTKRAGGGVMDSLARAQAGNYVVELVELVSRGTGWRAAQAVSRDGNWFTKNQFGRAATEVVLHGSPQPEEDPRQLVVPVWAGQPGLERILEATVEPLDHPVGLRMVGGRGGESDAEQGGHLCPQLGCELGTTVAGQQGGYAKPGDPVIQQRCADGRSGGVGQGDRLWPPGEPVHHRQEVGASTGVGQGSDQVDVQVGKTGVRGGKKLHRGADVAVNLGALTGDTGRRPRAHVFG